ncbi:ankyrin repeat-containing domain protein [Trichoderma barbatum]
MGDREIRIRRGYWDHKVVVLNPESRHYLDLIIANNDTLNEFFSVNTNEATCHFPLHRAAIAGLLGATAGFYNMLCSPIPSRPQTDFEGRTPFHMAALCGSEGVLKFLINKVVSGDLQPAIDLGEILDAKDSYLETALMVAVRMGNVVAAKILLESGARADIQDDFGRTALHFAVSNCPQLIRSLMDQNDLVAFIADRDGCTPLHVATKHASLEATSILLEALGQVDRLSHAISAKDNTGKTALQYAAERGCEEISRCLASAKYKGYAEMDDIERAAELAAMNGHLKTLRAIVDQECIRKFGSQVLNAAACSNQLLVVYCLLQNGASPNEKLKDGHIILSNALAKGLTEVVRALLEYGSDINAADSSGQTPLHCAAEHGMCEIAEILFAHKSITGQQANIDAPDRYRYTPLHYAARAGEREMVELLLQNKASTNHQSHRGETPLHVAVEYPTVVRLLAEAGSRLDALTLYESTPLHFAVIKGSLESAKVLLEQGASWDTVDYENNSPLRYAIVANDVTIVEAIIQHRLKLKKCVEISWADLKSAMVPSARRIMEFLVKWLPSILSMKDDNDNTPLHAAAECSDVGILALLLDAGSDIDALNNNKETPLFRSIALNKVDNLRFLMKRGGNVNQSRAEGRTLLHDAAFLGHVEGAVALLDAGAILNKPDARQMTPLYLAAQQCKAEMVELLLKKGADPNMTTAGGWSPLQSSISSDDPENSGAQICDLLISYNANINHQAGGLWTALQLAVDWNKEYAMEVLLENGADPNIAQEDGLTAFHISFECGVTNLMLDHPKAGIIDLEKMTRNGKAPIHLAVEEGECEIVELLLNKGVNFKAKTIQGLSCLDLASSRDTPNILKILLDRGWDIGDIASAYWWAIRLFKRENVKMLLEKGTSLLDEISVEGLSGLEAWLLMRPRTEIEQDTLLAVDFLKTEENSLFIRRAKLSMSIFELCVFSQEEFNVKLLRSCLEYLPKKMKMGGLGFREFRVATEVGRNELDIWDRLKSLKKHMLDRIKFRKRQSKEERDQDGWNLDQFLYQAEPRQSYDTWDTGAMNCPAKTPSALFVPPLWYAPDAYIGALVDILPAGLEARFKAGYKDGDIRSIRSDFPFPPRNLGHSYFEVTIHDLENEGVEEVVGNPLNGSRSTSKTEPPTIYIGFSGEFSIIKDAHPGWNVWSAGYHGGAGKVYQENCSASEALTTNLTYGPGDTVGCGIDTTQEQHHIP